MSSVGKAALHTAVIVCCTALMSCAPAADSPMLDLPPRPDGAPDAAAIVAAIRDVDLRRREETIYEQIAAGNVPETLRRLEPVVMTGGGTDDDAGDVTHRITFWVTPDYLAVGSDRDHFLVAVSARTAHRIAAAANASLPTAGMVDAIWLAADERIPPIRIEPDDERGSMRYIERHDNLIRAQRQLHRVAPDAFVAGHKVDLVLPPVDAESPAPDYATSTADDATSTARDATSRDTVVQPGTATVYGWHQTDGQPIQSLFTSPTDSLVVFNHGVRLVHRLVLVDGVERDLSDVLADPVLGRILRGRGSTGPRAPR